MVQITLDAIACLHLGGCNSLIGCRDIKEELLSITFEAVRKGWCTLLTWIRLGGKYEDESENERDPNVSPLTSECASLNLGCELASGFAHFQV